MKFMTVAEASAKWNIPERTVRYYCAEGKIPHVERSGRRWLIPETAENPTSATRKDGLPVNLLERLKVEKEHQISGGIYHKIQVDLTYNSNHIEGSRLSHDQTRYIYETKTISTEDGPVSVDDVVETANHFRCVDLIIDHARHQLSETFIKELHRTLKNGTSDSRLSWFAVGDYKKEANEVGGEVTTLPENVHTEMKKLIDEYNRLEQVSFDDILNFHYRFERIHPFQDGNGRIGRLIMFKECLRWNIVPFIIDNRHKNFYYRGLKEYETMPGYLRDTCLLMQDDFRAYLDYFGIAAETE